MHPSICWSEQITPVFSLCTKGFVRRAPQWIYKFMLAREKLLGCLEQYWGLQDWYFACNLKVLPVVKYLRMKLLLQTWHWSIFVSFLYTSAHLRNICELFCLSRYNAEFFEWSQSTLGWYGPWKKQYICFFGVLEDSRRFWQKLVKRRWKKESHPMHF